MHSGDAVVVRRAIPADRGETAIRTKLEDIVELAEGQEIPAEGMA